MTPAPNPTELHGELDDAEVAQHRHLDCKHYDACLQQASVARRAEQGERESLFWESWTCTRCPLWAERGEAKQDPTPFAERRHGEHCHTSLSRIAS